LEPPGGWPAFFLGKPAGTPTPDPAFIQKGAAAPGVGAVIGLYNVCAGNGGTSDNKGGGPRLQKGRHYYGGQQSV